MQTSELLDKLAPALAKAQAVVGGAKKDSANPHFKSKYADLASIWDACRSPLADNGLSVIQAPGPCVESRMEMTTMLLHASGQFIRETLSIPLAKVDAQGYGSATTYARRYALAAMVGVAPEDDDGNAASQPSASVAPILTSNGPLPKALSGPHKTKTALSAAVKHFMHEVNRAPDSDSLDAYLVSEKALLDQVRTDFPDWWHGDGERIPQGIGEQITNRVNALRDEAMQEAA